MSTECPWALPCADYIKIKCLVSASRKYYRCPGHYLWLPKVSNMIACDKYVNFNAVIMQAPSTEGVQWVILVPLNSLDDAFRIVNSVISLCFPHISCSSCAWIPDHWTFYSDQCIWTVIPLLFKMENKSQKYISVKITFLEKGRCWGQFALSLFNLRKMGYYIQMICFYHKVKIFPFPLNHSFFFVSYHFSFQ